MNRRGLWLPAYAAGLVLSLAAGPAGSQVPYPAIERLEASRSLGGGTLAAYLKSSDRLVALRAALAIGRTKEAGGVPLLLGQVRSPDRAMRAMALYGLGLIGGKPAVPAVLRALGDPSDTVKIAALDAVTRLELGHSLQPPAEIAAARQTQRLLRAGTRLVRARSATALEAFGGGPAAGGALASLGAAYANEQDAFVRWHVMWTVFRGYANAAPAALLAAGLRDADEVVRIEAVRAYGKRADASAVALLRPLLADPSWRVQEQTQESIAVLQGGKQTEHYSAIPAFVHVPGPQPDPLGALPPLARTPAQGKPGAPVPDAILREPKLLPATPELFTGPATGPHPRMRIATTKGNVYVELYPEWAPLTVENFMDLANRGYYDNNPWFRIVPDFVVQTGDPTGNGNGDAGYTIPAEENPIEQDSYVVSMGLNYTDPPNAHAVRDSAGTQFYITLSPQLHLNTDFTVFGRVIGGAWVLGRLIESDKIVRVERIADTTT